MGTDEVAQKGLSHADSSGGFENTSNTGPILGCYRGPQINFEGGDRTKKSGHLAGMSAQLLAGPLWTAKRYKIHHMWGEVVKGVGHACILKKRVQFKHGLASNAIFLSLYEPCAL